MPYLSLLLALALIAGLAAGIVIDRPPVLVASLAPRCLVDIRGARVPHVVAARVPGELDVCDSRPPDCSSVGTRSTVRCTRLCGQRLRTGAAAVMLSKRRMMAGSTSLWWSRAGCVVDAAVTESGVSLTVDMHRTVVRRAPSERGRRRLAWRRRCAESRGERRRRKGTRSVPRGVATTVAVSQRRPRAIRSVRLPAAGTTLIGAMKSAALIEVVEAPWVVGTFVCATARSVARAALSRHVGRPTRRPRRRSPRRILIGDRGALDPRRRAAAAGSRDVSRDRDLRRQHRDPRRDDARRPRWRAGCVAESALLLTMAGVVAYAFVAEGGASVARATLMAVIYLAVRTIDHRTAAANAIGLAAAAILLVTPLAVADVGFWLTFGASAAILIGATHVPGGSRGWLRVAWSVLAATMAAEVALAPVSALVFQRVTLAGLGLNFIALPAMTLVQLAAIAVVLLDAVSQTLAGWASLVVHLGCVALLESARGVDYAPWLTWRVPSPAPWLVGGYYATLAAWAWIRRASGAWPQRACCILATLLFVWMVTAPDARVRARGDGRLHLLNDRCRSGRQRACDLS